MHQVTKTTNQVGKTTVVTTYTCTQQTTTEDGALRVKTDYNLTGTPITTVTNWGHGNMMWYLHIREGGSHVAGGRYNDIYPFGWPAYQDGLPESALVQGF
jgi:hypothetical protein